MVACEFVSPTTVLEDSHTRQTLSVFRSRVFCRVSIEVGRNMSTTEFTAKTRTDRSHDNPAEYRQARVGELERHPRTEQTATAPTPPRQQIVYLPVPDPIHTSFLGTRGWQLIRKLWIGEPVSRKTRLRGVVLEQGRPPAVVSQQRHERRLSVGRVEGAVWNW